MTAQELLDEIFKTKTVTDEKGNKYKLHSNIDEAEGEFIKKIIKENRFIKTIEIGCAYGISSLYICLALSHSKKSHHTIIDPFQSTDWKNIGKFNLERAGINFFEIIEKPSEIVLPQLLSKGERYDFAFIDGWHTFDHTLVDFFYLNKLIKVGGVIVIDDVGFKSINKLMRYILNYPSYKLIGNVEEKVSTRRKLFDFLVKSPFRIISKLFPERIKYELFASKVVKSDKILKLNSSMIAIKKIREDERTWSWFKDF